MAQYTNQQAEDLLPSVEQKHNTLLFFRWILAIYQYFFVYTDSSIRLNYQVLSGQVGVLQAYAKNYIGVDIEVKDNYSSFFPYRSPYDAEIIIAEDATIEQFNGIVEIFEFYKLAGKSFVYKYGSPVIPENNTPYTYFELGFNNLPAADSYDYFELGLQQ